MNSPRRVWYKYGRYDPQEGWRIYEQCRRQVVRLQIYHLFDCFEAGLRPLECKKGPPPGRTVMEFMAAAWTGLYRYFRTAEAHGHTEPEWLEFTCVLEGVERKYHGRLDEIVDVVYGIVLDRLNESLARQYEQWEAPRYYGVFGWQVRDDYIAMHFHNVHRPDSPFERPAVLLQCLGIIIDEIAEKGYDIKRIGMDSWVNNLKGFQAVFPPSYAASLTPTNPDVKGGDGWWGQFVTRTGEFNHRRARILRETRRFEFARLHGECPYEEFRLYVRENTT
ncbi:MAG: hypothetical protein J7M14_02875 [Planctomycetes bacterium]|nr:hypothetical protein [Planctomycetota bacterium]